MTKSDLIDLVSQDLGLSKVDSQRTLESILRRITEGLANEGKVQIQGFGTFQRKERKERMGRNPQTKQPMLIPASRTVTFRPGQDLKSKM